MTYLPIENYGVVGDLHTVALIGLNGSVDWLCFPVFDLPSVFGAILDEEKGGRFQIYPADDHLKVKQMYLPDTNVLITRFLSPNGLAELTDFMPIEDKTNEAWNHRLVRRVKVVQGTYRFKMVCQPAFDYARAAHTAEMSEGGVVFHSQNLSLGLASEIPMTIQDGAAVCEFTLEHGQSACFMLHRVEDAGPCAQAFQEEEVTAIMDDTIKFWRNWISKCTYEGRWREMVRRSALVLKLLTYAPTGAIVAAPTTSLPERSAANATGTTAIPGSGTPVSPAMPCSILASRRKRPVLWNGLRPAAANSTPKQAACKSCTALTVATN